MPFGVAGAGLGRPFCVRRTCGECKGVRAGGRGQYVQSRMTGDCHSAHRAVGCASPRPRCHESAGIVQPGHGPGRARSTRRPEVAEHLQSGVSGEYLQQWPATLGTGSCEAPRVPPTCEARRPGRIDRPEQWSDLIDLGTDHRHAEVERDLVRQQAKGLCGVCRHDHVDVQSNPADLANRPESSERALEVHPTPGRAPDRGAEVVEAVAQHADGSDAASDQPDDELVSQLAVPEYQHERPGGIPPRGVPCRPTFDHLGQLSVETRAT